MSESLIFTHFLFFGERCEWIAHFAQIKWAMWANCSGCSPKMSNHERFAQVAQRKWAIVSESLRSLTKIERMSESLIFLSESLIRSFLDKKQAIPWEIKWANSQPCNYSSRETLFSRYIFSSGVEREGAAVWWRILMISGQLYTVPAENNHFPPTRIPQPHITTRYHLPHA